MKKPTPHERVLTERWSGAGATDERREGGGSGLRAGRQHALVDADRLARLAAHVARDDDCVEGSRLWVDAL